MFKEACANFANQKGITSIYVHEYIDESSRTHEGTFRWYFHKEMDGNKIPASIEFKTRFHKHTSKKDLTVDANFPFPIQEMVELANEFIEYMEPHFKKYFTDFDKDRLRKITNGHNYQGHTVNHVRDLNKLIEAFKKSNRAFTEKQMETIYEQMTKELLGLPRDAKGDDERYLIVHGKKGRQFGEKLKANMLADYKEIQKDVYAIEFLFPFQKGAKSRHLTGAYLKYGSPRWLREKGLVCFVMSEDELKVYKKDE